MNLLLALLVLLAPVVGLPLEGDMTVSYSIITPDGVTFNLTGTGYAVLGVDGWGMPPMRYRTRVVPQRDGAVVDGINVSPRIVTVTQEVYGTSRGDYHTKMASIVQKLSPWRSTDMDPLRLRYTEGSDSADLYCYFDGEIIQTRGVMSATVGFRLVAYDPYWYATTETSTSGLGADGLAVSYILGRIDGTWSAMGNNGTERVWCMTTDTEGDLYIGGDFTSWAGEGNANYLAKYDVSAGTWSAIGSSLNARVEAIAVAPNGDVYIGGGFFNAGGVSAADYIAVFRSGGSQWESIGTFDATVRALCLTDDGYLWAGGHFTDAGGTAANLIAYMDVGAPGTWYAAAGMTTSTWGVISIVQGLDGTIYAGGSFENVNSDADLDYLVYWTGSAWAGVGSVAPNNYVYSMDVGADGILYVGGGFTTWDGETVNYIAKWDGHSVLDMDGGADSVIWSVTVGDDQRIYASGSFSEVGDVTADYCAVWNNNQWQSLSVDLPGTSNVAVATFEDNLFFGFDTTGWAVVPSDTTVTNGGDVPTPPTIEVAGPGTITSIRNETTDEEIAADLYVNDGETVTIDLGDPGDHPTGIAITSDWSGRPNGSNLLGKILNPVSLADFDLVPSPIASSGANKISVLLTDNPTETGDGGSQLSRWAGVTGLTTSNTDNGRIYVNIVSDDGGYYHVNLYSDSARSALIAHTASYNSTGSKSLTADNTSGVGGAIYVDSVETLGSEVLVNGGFETAGAGGADIWANWAEVAGDGALANETTIVNAGSDAAKLTCGASDNTDINQTQAVSADSIYRLAYAARGDGSASGRYDVYDITNSAHIIASKTSVGVTGTSYEDKKKDFTTPSGCVSMFVRFWPGGTSGDVAYFDDVSVKPVTYGANSSITVDYALVTVKHWNRYLTVHGAVS